MSEHETEASDVPGGRPEKTEPEELSDEGVGLTTGEDSTFEPEEDPDSEADPGAPNPA